MKKLFTLFAAVLMAASMMAKTGDGIASVTSFSSLKDFDNITFQLDGMIGPDLISSSKSPMVVLADVEQQVSYAVWSPLAGDTYSYNNGVFTFSGLHALSPVTVSLPAEETQLFLHFVGITTDGDRGDFATPALYTPVNDTIDMTFDSEGLRYYYYDEETLSWNLSWQGKEQSSKTHKLALYRTTNLANKFGHFTTADFDLTKSYYSNVGAEGEFVTEIDVTLTETEYGFTISGYVVAADGITYNLAGEYAAPKATPSVTTFTTLSELDGLTITLSGVAVQFAGEDGSIYLTNNESETCIYGKVENYTFNNNVLTIEGFVYDAEEMTPLPEEDQDLLIMSDNVFEGYYVLPLCTIHFGTSPSAVENVEAVVKAQKLIENGQMVIIREGKRYNAVGAEL